MTAADDPRAYEWPRDGREGGAAGSLVPAEGVGAGESVEALRSNPCLTSWHRGLTCDHIYGDCPNLRRGEAELRQVGWWDEEPIESTLDPHGGDVCGMCLHRHNRTRHRKSA